MRRRARLWLIVWALGLAPAHAATPTEQDAHTLVREGRYPEAIAAFERLYAQRPAPRLLLNIAAIYTLYMPGRCADALGALDRFFIVCADCTLRAEAESLRTRTHRTCMGRLTIETTPPGAQVRFGDTHPVVSPTTVELVEGGHVVSVELDGYHRVERSVVVHGGEVGRFEIELRPLDDPAERLFAHGRALADVGQTAAALDAFTEGEALEDSPRFALGIARTALALGDCPRTRAALDRFRSRCADCPQRAQADPLRIAYHATCTPQPPAADDGPSPWIWGGLGVGLAGVGAGVIFHRQYFDGVEARDAAQDRGESIVTLRALHDDATADYQLAQAGYIVGAAGLLTAALVWWLDEPAPSAANAGSRLGAPGVVVSF